MSDPRISGLALMGLAIAAFLGSTTEQLPAITFFPALVLFVIGAFRFMRANSVAMARAEKEIERRIHPRLPESRQAQAHAERLAARRGLALSSVAELDDDPERAARLASGASTRGPLDAVALDEGDTELIVSGDVSFPIEVQRGDALADQLRKLSQLLAQGVLTEEEYAVAKAKLLS